MSLGKLDAKTRSIHEFAVSGHIVKVQQPISGTFLSILYRFVLAAWPSGKAGDCKSFFPSSNPGVACSTLIDLRVSRVGPGGSLNAFFFLLIGVSSQRLARVRKKGEQAHLESAVQRRVVCCVREG